METKQKIYTISFELNEVKQLIIDRIDDAQDVRNQYCLSKCKTYEIWHQPLIEYYKKHKKKMTPSMADKLTYVILLSYTKPIINRLNKISDIKLYNKNLKEDKESDFIHIEIISSKTSTYDCICSKHKLSVIHIVENKYSGIRLQVGSVCIERSKLLTNEEYKKFKESEKEYDRKQREQKKEQKLLEQQRKEYEEKMKDYDPCMDCGKLEIHKSESRWRIRCIPCFKIYKQEEQEKKEAENKPLLPKGVCFLKMK